MQQLRKNIEALGAYGYMIYEVCRDICLHGVNVKELSR